MGRLGSWYWLTPQEITTNWKNGQQYPHAKCNTSLVHHLLTVCRISVSTFLLTDNLLKILRKQSYEKPISWVSIAFPGCNIKKSSCEWSLIYMLSITLISACGIGQKPKASTRTIYYGKTYNQFILFYLKSGPQVNRTIGQSLQEGLMPVSKCERYISWPRGHDERDHGGAIPASRLQRFDEFLDLPYLDILISVPSSVRHLHSHFLPQAPT